MRPIFTAALLALSAYAADAQQHASATKDLVSSRIPGLMDSAGIPGLSMAYIENGEVAWTKGFGMRSIDTHKLVDENTVFEAASLSKPVVAYATLKLVDAGLLDLDRPLTEYIAIPELSDGRATRITTRMILSHTTGLQNERHGDEPLALAFNPGEKWSYSGEGFVLLQRALEKITGEPLNDLAQRLVFTPLEMRRSAFIWKKKFASNAARGHGDFETPRTPTRPTRARAPSSLHTTAHDYALFVRAIMRRQGLKQSTVDEMIKPQVQIAPGAAWGLGWSLETSDSARSIWHWGDNSNSGFTSFVMIDPARHNAVVYFANSTTGLGIMPWVTTLLGGSHPAPSRLGYESYNAPSRKVRVAIERAVRARGATAGLAVYDSLKADNDAAAFPESLLNTLGYRFLSLKLPRDAIALFERNAQLFPQSANVFDSLGDGYAAAGDTAAAIESYMKSYALDNRNQHALTEANRLRSKRASK